MIWPWRARREFFLDQAVWAEVLHALPFMAAIPAPLTDRLRALMAQFLTDRVITGAGGLEVTDAMRAQVAAQACLPILELGFAAYDAFSEVIMHPGAFRVRRQIEAPGGVMVDLEDSLAGEALPGGPVVLSWADARELGRAGLGNLVIHEFAHKLDLAHGEADGCPAMPAALRRQWIPALHRAFDEFNQMLDRVEAAIPANIDPDSEQADPWYELLPLDPYAATDHAEFFAVATEKFFVDPQVLRAEFPQFHEQAVRYFGFDPGLWTR
jgi:Mlc titration factor MtfA (ptsG expression regulator)